MIWEKCQGAARLQRVAGRLYRLVESQALVATLDYVDTLEEQAVLEELLERGKPAYPDQCHGLHYLLKTPFRYPPLPWGSRFGRSHEAGIFYGALSVETTLAEVAYYRFLFRDSIEMPEPGPLMRSEHTLFRAAYRSDRGIRLQEEPFARFQAQLRHPADYSHTQALGSQMREAGIDAFEYVSARDPLAGTCVGLFSPAVFTRKVPQETSQWLCETGDRLVSFKRPGEPVVKRLYLESYLVGDELPRPA